MADCQDEFTHEIVSDADKTKSCEATRTHELVQTGESIEAANRTEDPITNIMICESHLPKTVSEFCVTHKKAICRLCKGNKHRDCDTKALCEAAEENKKNIKSFIEDVKLLSSDFEEMKHSRYSYKSQVLEKTTQIRTYVKKIKDEVKIWAEEALEEIEKNEKDLVLKIDHHIEKTAEMINQLKLVKTLLEKLDLDNNCTEEFIVKTKTELQIDEGRELKQEIETEVSSLTFNFRESEKLSILMSKISSFGTKAAEETGFIDFKDISSVMKKADIPVDSGFISGCVFMPNGELVICDHSNKVKILKSECTGKLKNELECDSPVWDIAVLSRDEVIVTKTESKCLQVLNVSTTAKTVKSIQVGETCWGVDIKKDKIYVGCHSNDGKGGNIKVITLDGGCVNTLQIGEGKPFYLAVNEAADRIMTCTQKTSKALCIDMAGNIIFTYSNTEMEYSLGILFDTHDNFMVCGRQENNIHVVKKDGTKHKILLSFDDGLYQPYCLAYRATDKTLVVGQCAKKSLTAFSIEI